MAHDYWYVAQRSDGKPIPPLDGNPGHEDEGLLVYRSEEACTEQCYSHWNEHKIFAVPRRLSELPEKYRTA